MIQTIVLDSSPLALIVHQKLIAPVVDCRAWIEQQVLAGVRVLVPAIIAYELRRELLRLRHQKSILLLDEFITRMPNRYLPLTDGQLTHAAQLWASLRHQGRPTAVADALDIDVILAAQALSLGLPPGDFVVATGNEAHLSLLVPARPWQQI